MRTNISGLSLGPRPPLVPGLSLGLFPGLSLGPQPQLGIVVCAIAASLSLGCGEDGEGKKGPIMYGTMKPPPQAWKAAVGDGGILLETFDDASWEVRKVTDRDLYAVSCVDNEVGWAVGARGFIGHTRDGGWSWPAQESGVTQTLHAVSFAFAADGSEVGLAVGDGATLVTTRDGGASWTRVALESEATLRGTAITEGASLMLAVGDGGLVLRSSDRGASFGSYRIPEATDLFDVALDAAGGLALAVDSAGHIWLSRDAAKTFQLEHSAATALEGVSLGRTGMLGSAAGSGLALLRSSDGSWSNLPSDEALALHATLVGPREDRVYFAGDSGALLETVDGGRSLFRVPSDTNAALRGIEDLEAR
jgi:photosystem II stability/assembly factor-like uncharacterized protein